MWNENQELGTRTGNQNREPGTGNQNREPEPGTGNPELGTLPVPPIEAISYNPRGAHAVE
jgi:hypothetical protein